MPRHLDLRDDNQQPPNASLRVLGVDLGTTNSSASEQIWYSETSAPEDVRCIEVEQPTLEGVSTHQLVPSIVALYQGRDYIGEGAKRMRARSQAYGLEPYRSLFYDCKNDIGIRRTYHRAPEGYRSATEIGSKVLAFLQAAAEAESDVPIGRTVITVPASFQVAQRLATLEAAKLAGIPLNGGDLLDEPVAAFLDYVFSYSGPELLTSSSASNLLVFDFGGGTCDVAIFRLTTEQAGSGIGMSPLSVSRYHRLGGTDIDAAIVHNILIPQLVNQNEIDPFALEYSDKKQQLEPSLLGIAESLKISLCTQISRLQDFNKYDDADKNTITQTLPGSYPCRAAGKDFELQAPTLTAAEMDGLLTPFLDQDLLYPQETEYRWTCSIFAPLQDALDRCQLNCGEIDYCLLTGGSSLIPQVVDAVTRFFDDAKILKYPDRDAVHASVSRGAALHAMSLAITGRGLVQPVCHDTIALRTQSGPMELVKQGVSLPYPSDEGYSQLTGLSVPGRGKSAAGDIRVEVVAGPEERSLFRTTWKLPLTAKPGQPLRLTYRYDANQSLELRLVLPETEDVFEAVIEHPLTHVVNPNSKRMRLYEIEEQLRTGQVPALGQRQAMLDIAELYGDLGQFEKGLEFLKRIPQSVGAVDPGILNRMGTYAMRLRDYARTEKFYRHAAQSTTQNYPLFNLALAFKAQGRYQDALATIDEALARERDAPALVMRAIIADHAQPKQSGTAYLDEALATFDPISALNDFELSWYLTATRMRGDHAKTQEAQEEQKHRARSGHGYQAEYAGELPSVDATDNGRGNT